MKSERTRVDTKDEGKDKTPIAIVIVKPIAIVWDYIPPGSLLPEAVNE